MVEREVVLMKPKHHFIFPNEENEFMCTQSLKERRLLYESVFISIKWWTLTLKLVEWEVIPIKKSINIIYPNELNMFIGC